MLGGQRNAAPITMLGLCRTLGVSGLVTRRPACSSSSKRGGDATDQVVRLTTSASFRQSRPRENNLKLWQGRLALARGSEPSVYFWSVYRSVIVPTPEVSPLDTQHSAPLDIRFIEFRCMPAAAEWCECSKGFVALLGRQTASVRHDCCNKSEEVLPVPSSAMGVF